MIIQKVEMDAGNFSWINYDSYSDSNASKFEIYCKGAEKNAQSLIDLFKHLFDGKFSDLVIGQPSLEMEWGQFCIDTWDFENNLSDYSFEEKSIETIDYLDLLLESKIEFDYKGFCKCNDWTNFLSIVLECILNHKAPYSLLFYNSKEGYFFYFHHTFSLGLYYKELNHTIENILQRAKIANGNYEVV